MYRHGLVIDEVWIVKAWIVEGGTVRRFSARVNKFLHGVVLHGLSQVVVGLSHLFVNILEEIVLHMAIKRYDWSGEGIARSREN